MLLGARDIFLLSALAKLGSTIATYPLLVIKSRIQVRVCRVPHSSNASRGLSALARLGPSSPLRTLPWPWSSGL